MNRKLTKEDWIASLTEALDLEAVIVDSEGSLLFATSALNPPPSHEVLKELLSCDERMHHIQINKSLKKVELTTYSTEENSYTLILFKDPSKEELPRNRLGSAISDIAHDMKNSVGVIKGFAALLVQDLPLEKRKSMAKNILQASDDLNSLISNLSDYSTPLKLEKKEVDLPILLKDSVDYFLKSGVQGEQQIIFGETPKSITVFIDPQIFRDAFIALLTNACEASPNNKPIEIRIEEKPSVYKIQIIDQGVGISEKVEGTLFEILSSTKGRSRGLGLAQAEKRMHAHSATIELTNNSKSGTTCTITLPRTP